MHKNSLSKSYRKVQMSSSSGPMHRFLQLNSVWVWRSIVPEVEKEDVGGGPHGLGGENHHQHQDVTQHANSCPGKHRSE
jgi:hypothetical protein